MYVLLVVKWNNIIYYAWRRQKWIATSFLGEKNFLTYQFQTIRREAAAGHFLYRKNAVNIDF